MVASPELGNGDSRDLSQAASGVREPAFTLDTSGAVMCPSGSSTMPFTAFRWPDLSPFAQGYVEAMFASLIEEWRHQVGFKAGDKVRVHTDEVGTVTARDTGRTKSVHVLFRPGFGGEYFPFECTPVAPAYSDLAAETVAAILKDCESFSAKFTPPTKDGGRQFYIDRQRGLLKNFPPFAAFIGDDGKVRAKPAADTSDGQVSPGRDQ